MEKELTLRERFLAEGYSVAGYARAKGLDRVTLSYVLLGKFDGKRNRKGSNVRKIILQLREDGVWTDELAWDKKERA